MTLPAMPAVSFSFLCKQKPVPTKFNLVTIDIDVNCLEPSIVLQSVRKLSEKI